MKLLIVEDEDEIRNGIKSVINWAKYDIEICDGAENGKVAVDILPKDKPELLLLDIQMPVMNGLEVLHYIKESRLNIKSIVLSGYDDFSYVQKALQLGVSDYLLKPCEPDDILHTVLKAKELIEKEKAQKELMEKYTLHLKENIILLKEKFLLRLVQNKVDFTPTLYTLFEKYDIALQKNNITVSILTLDDIPIQNHHTFNNDIELLKFAIRNIANELIQPIFTTEFITQDDQLIGLHNISSSDYKQFITNLTSTQQAVKDFLGVTVSISIGRIYDSIEEISLSYKDAQTSLEQKFWVNAPSILEYTTKEDSNLTTFTYPLAKEKDLLLLLTSAMPNEHQISSALDSFFQSLSSFSTDIVLHCGLMLGLSIYKVYIEKKVDKSSIDDHIFAYLDKIHKCTTLHALKTILFNLVQHVITDLNITQYTNKTINLAILYISKNFQKDISLDIVADHVNVTPSYLSSLFKKNCGINFVEYLHKLRIQKACEIVKKDLWIKGCELAPRVGYNEERYFYRIFKKMTGLTLSQYKETL